MKKNEDLNITMTEVEKYVEIKKASILKKNLQKFPLVSEGEKIRMLTQLEEIRNSFKMSPEVFEKTLGDFDQQMYSVYPAKEKEVEKVGKGGMGRRERDEKKETPKKVVFGIISYCVSRGCRFRFVSFESSLKVIKHCQKCNGPTLRLTDVND